MPGAAHDDRWRSLHIMRALEQEVVDAIWAAIEPLLPASDRSHPLGCHRPRVSGRLCFRGLLIRLVTGASWVDIEAILDHQVLVSDTTLRARRDEWIAAGVFEALKTEALAAFDRIVGLDLEHVALDGSLHKAPCGGEGTGPNPTDRAKLGWKWSVASERHGIPSAGRSTAPTAKTSPCSNPPSPMSRPTASSPTSTPSTSTGAMTPAPFATAYEPRASTSSRSNDAAPRSPG